MKRSAVFIGRQRNLQAAEDEFQKELAIDPHNTLALYKLGSIRVESGSPKEGLPLLEKAVGQNLSVVDAYYYLGKAQGQLGQVDAAVGSLRRVIDGEASPELKESAYYQLSVIYRKLGRVDDAELRSPLSRN
ncbi:MAG: tetratricopeptide repeat protein [Pyrinomonadaceae bacterium]